jgi:hypothetical protein
MSIFVYVLYHDEPSRNTADELIQRAERREEEDALGGASRVRTIFVPLKLEPSPLLESVAFLLIDARRAEWENADYVGLITYSIDSKRAKMAGGSEQGDIRFGQLTTVAKDRGADVIGLFNVGFHKDHKHVSCLEGSVFQHGLHYFRAWSALMGRMGYSDEETRADVETFFSNWWLATPSCMRAYIAFFKKAVEIIWGDGATSSLDIDRRALLIHEDDVKLRDMFYENAHYKGSMSENQCRSHFGVPYYSVTPFVFERIPALFFHRLGARTLMYPPRLVMKLKE